MSDAVVVQDAYKKFGSLYGPFWKWFAHSNGRLKGKMDIYNTNPVIVAVDHVSFTVEQGEIFGVLGPSGSGKSTLIRLLATLLLPDSGDIRIFGFDVVRQPLQVQRLINRVSVEASFFKKLSPMENLVHGTRTYGMSEKRTRRQVVELLTRLGLEQQAIFEPMEKMSRSKQQKVAIARALLSRPRLLLLDEPTAGLDSQSKREVQAAIRDLRHEHGTTILLTTNDMLEAANLCDRIAVINGGKIVAMDTSQGLQRAIPYSGHEPTPEDIFLELADKLLVKEEIS